MFQPENKIPLIFLWDKELYLTWTSRLELYITTITCLKGRLASQWPSRDRPPSGSVSWLLIITLCTWTWIINTSLAPLHTMQHSISLRYYLPSVQPTQRVVLLHSLCELLNILLLQSLHDALECWLINIPGCQESFDYNLDQFSLSAVPEGRILLLVFLNCVLGVQSVDTEMTERRPEKLIFGRIF